VHTKGGEFIGNIPTHSSPPSPQPSHVCLMPVLDLLGAVISFLLKKSTKELDWRSNSLISIASQSVSRWHKLNMCGQKSPCCSQNTHKDNSFKEGDGPFENPPSCSPLLSTCPALKFVMYWFLGASKCYTLAQTIHAYESKVLVLVLSADGSLLASCGK
jgi:hypothetical protein